MVIFEVYNELEKLVATEVVKDLGKTEHFYNALLEDGSNIFVSANDNKTGFITISHGFFTLDEEKSELFKVIEEVDVPFSEIQGLTAVELKNEIDSQQYF